MKRLLLSFFVIFAFFSVIFADSGTGKSLEKDLYFHKQDLKDLFRYKFMYASGSEALGLLKDIEFSNPVFLMDGGGAVSSARFSQAFKKRFARALLFNGSFILISSVNYWLKYSDWVEDWQYQLNWKDQKRRFFSFEANRFDSNPFMTNWTHSLSGGIYYTFARYNNMTALESQIFTMMTSLFWEYVTEWREVISVNDNFFTGFGGISIGEPLFQVSSYFNRKPGFLNKVLGFVFNPIITINSLLDRDGYRPMDKGLASFRPKFDLYMGLQDVSFSQSAQKGGSWINLRLETRFNTIEGYKDPTQEKLDRFVKTTLLSDVHLGLTLSSDGMEEYSFLTRAILFGHFSQRLMQDESGQVKGHSFFVGAGSSFDFYRKKAIADYDIGEFHFDFNIPSDKAPLPTQFTDKLAVMNIIGPYLDLSLYSGNFSLNASLAAFFDFALVGSMAINDYSSIHDIYEPMMKTTLSYYGYYFAFGYTLHPRLELYYGNLELKGDLKYQRFNSIEGIDRFQEEQVEDDCNIVDSRFAYQLSLGYTFSKGPLSIVFAYEGIERQGTLKEITSRVKENRIFSQLRFTF